MHVRTDRVAVACAGTAIVPFAAGLVLFAARVESPPMLRSFLAATTVSLIVVALAAAGVHNLVGMIRDAVVERGEDARRWVPVAIRDGFAVERRETVRELSDVVAQERVQAVAVLQADLAPVVQSQRSIEAFLGAYAVGLNEVSKQLDRIRRRLEGMPTVAQVREEAHDAYLEFAVELLELGVKVAEEKGRRRPPENRL